MTAIVFPLEVEVVLEEKEVADLSAISLARAVNRGRGRRVWLPVLVGALGGLALALAVVLSRAIRPERAGGVAAGGFALFWGGVWWQYLAGLRAWKRRTRASWAAAEHRYTVRIDPTGVTAWTANRRVWTSWAHESSVERLPGIVALWSREGAMLAIPDRCLPPETTPEALVAGLNAAMAAEAAEAAGGS